MVKSPGPRKTLMEVIPSFGVDDTFQAAWSSGKEALALGLAILDIEN
jgi:hypothetical protein